MKFNIARPSAHATDAMALYDKLRSMDDDDDDRTGELLGGLFNIVAKLEAQAQEKADADSD